VPGWWWDGKGGKGGGENDCRTYSWSDGGVWTARDVLGRERKSAGRKEGEAEMEVHNNKLTGRFGKRRNNEVYQGVGGGGEKRRKTSRAGRTLRQKQES